MQINSGSTQYSSRFPAGSTDQGQIMNTRGMRNWTVANAMNYYDRAAMGTIGGPGIFFNQNMVAVSGRNEVAGILLHGECGSISEAQAEAQTDAFAGRMSG
jgi:hypothetical protein